MLWPSVQKDLSVSCTCVLPGWVPDAADVPTDRGGLHLSSFPSWDPLHSLRVLDAPSPFFPGSLHWKEEEISIDISVFLCFQQDCWCFQSHAAKNDIPTKQTKQFEPSTKPYIPSKYQFSSKICLLWLIDFFYYYFCFLVFCPEFNWTKSKSTVIPACSEQKFPGGEIFYVLVLYKFM